jgi:molybdate transport system permease protein
MNTPPSHTNGHHVRSDAPFITVMCLLAGLYIVLIVAMLLADATYTTIPHMVEALTSPEILYSIKLSIVTCSLSAILSIWVAVPIGYLMSRHSFPGKRLLDSVLDIPIVLPPLVIGLSLLILFQNPLVRVLEDQFAVWTGSRVVHAIPAVVLAQFTVACAFAVRTMRATFDDISPRQEQVALTLGSTRSQAFWMVVLPQAYRGVVVAGTLAWCRSMGEFGPILVFAGSTRMKTEVLPTTVFLEMSIGNIPAAVAVSLVMVLLSLALLIVVRLCGRDTLVR